MYFLRFFPLTVRLQAWTRNRFMGSDFPVSLRGYTFRLSSALNTFTPMLLFSSNFFILFRCVRNSVPSQSNPLDCSLSSFEILSGFCSIGFSAQVTAHLKHSSSLFFILMIAFFLSIGLGRGLCPLSLSGWNSPTRISSRYTLRSLHPLPRLWYSEMDFSIFSFMMLETSPVLSVPVSLWFFYLKWATVDTYSPVFGSFLTTSHARDMFTFLGSVSEFISVVITIMTGRSEDLRTGREDRVLFIYIKHFTFKLILKSILFFFPNPKGLKVTMVVGSRTCG